MRSVNTILEAIVKSNKESNDDSAARAKDKPEDDRGELEGESKDAASQNGKANRVDNKKRRSSKKNSRGLRSSRISKRSRKA